MTRDNKAGLIRDAGVESAIVRQRQIDHSLALDAHGVVMILQPPIKPVRPGWKLDMTQLSALGQQVQITIDRGAAEARIQRVDIEIDLICAGMIVTRQHGFIHEPSLGRIAASWRQRACFDFSYWLHMYILHDITPSGKGVPTKFSLRATQTQISVQHTAKHDIIKKNCRGETGMDKLTCIRQIRDGETEAARLLFGEYGDGIYRRALATTKSKEAARTITRETILELIRTLREKNEADGWDLWVDAVTGRRIELYGLVDADVKQLSCELFGTSASVAATPETPAAEPPQPAPISEEPSSTEPLFDNSERRADGRKRARGASVGGVFATIVLILGILIMIWVILGFLKGLNILPQLDLGYTWFNENLFRLF